MSTSLDISRKFAFRFTTIGSVVTSADHNNKVAMGTIAPQLNLSPSKGRWNVTSGFNDIVHQFRRLLHQKPILVFFHDFVEPTANTLHYDITETSVILGSSVIYAFGSW